MMRFHFLRKTRTKQFVAISVMLLLSAMPIATFVFLWSIFTNTTYNSKSDKLWRFLCVLFVERLAF